MSETLIPLFAIVFTFGSIIAVVAITLKYRARKLEHDEIMKSIEQGQELPTLEIRRKPDYFTDLRNGIILLVTGIGIYLFFSEGSHSMKEMAGLGYIPAFIGVGLIAIALVVRSIAEKEKREEKENNGQQ